MSNRFSKKNIEFFLKILLGEKRYYTNKNKLLIKKIVRNNPNVKSICENNIFKNLHKGERCFILGNGPSLNSQDLTLLENEYVFTVNQISRHKDFEYIKPTYHFWADPIFFHLDPINKEDAELLEKMKMVNTVDNHPICFYEYEANELIKKYNLDNELDIRYYKCGEQFADINKCDIDMSKIMPSFSTVVHYAIAAAIYMGFSEIYFMGCESTSVLTSINVRLDEALTNDYAYDLTDNEAKRMRSRVEKVTFEQELYCFYKVISDYKLINSYCEERGIKLYNCTPGGLVEGVPRVKYETLFNEVSNE